MRHHQNRLQYSLITLPGVPAPITNVKLVDFSCGSNHMVAIDTGQKVYSWGFGGFGRLGHHVQKDEYVPRLIKAFDVQSWSVRSVHCGSAYTLAINDQGALYMFGTNKRSGVANLYPKPVLYLQGCGIKTIGTSVTSIMIAADDSLITWGAWPTFGELGTGENNRYSAKPKEVTSMNGLCITQITMGLSHTLLICDDRSEEIKQKLSDIPIFQPSD